VRGRIDGTDDARCDTGSLDQEERLQVGAFVSTAIQVPRFLRVVSGHADRKPCFSGLRILRRAFPEEVGGRLWDLRQERSPGFPCTRNADCQNDSCLEGDCYVDIG
jgi:hypothetical protein